MSGTHYVPEKEADFDAHYHNVVEYVLAKVMPATPEWTHIPKPTAEALAADYMAWHTAYEATLVPHVPAVTNVKNKALKKSKKALSEFKTRYLLFDPVTDADRLAMGIHIRDTHPTPSGVPTARAQVETFLKGRNQLGVNVVYVSGNPDDPANAGFRIWYTLRGPGEPPSAGPEDLHKSFFTHRKKDLMRALYGPSSVAVSCRTPREQRLRLTDI
jgi:hypothetical protein